MKNGQYLLLVVLLQFFLINPAFAQTRVVSNKGELLNALNSMNGGTILLRTGHYGEVSISNRNYSSQLRIKSADGHKATLKQLHIKNCSNMLIRDLRITPRFIKGGNDGYEAVLIKGNDIIFRNNVINYYGKKGVQLTRWQWLNFVGHGLRVIGDNIRVISNNISNVDFGIRATVTNSLIKNNRINWFRGDGITVSGTFKDSRDTVIEGNVIKNSCNIDENHNDGIQFYTRKDGVENLGVLSGFTVRNNIILQTEDPHRKYLTWMQGIVGFGGYEFRNFTIENNFIQTNHWLGVYFQTAGSNFVIRNNVALDIPYVGKQSPYVGLEPVSRNVTGMVVENNITNNQKFFSQNQKKLMGFDEETNVAIHLSEIRTHFDNYLTERIKLRSGSELNEVHQN